MTSEDCFSTGFRPMSRACSLNSGTGWEGAVRGLAPPHRGGGTASRASALPSARTRWGLALPPLRLAAVSASLPSFLLPPATAFLPSRTPGLTLMLRAGSSGHWAKGRCSKLAVIPIATQAHRPGVEPHSWIPDPGFSGAKRVPWAMLGLGQGWGWGGSGRQSRRGHLGTMAKPPLGRSL